MESERFNIERRKYEEPPFTEYWLPDVPNNPKDPEYHKMKEYLNGLLNEDEKIFIAEREKLMKMAVWRLRECFGIDLLEGDGWVRDKKELREVCDKVLKECIEYFKDPKGDLYPRVREVMSRFIQRCYKDGWDGVLRSLKSDLKNYPEEKLKNNPKLQKRINNIIKHNDESGLLSLVAEFSKKGELLPTQIEFMNGKNRDVIVRNENL